MSKDRNTEARTIIGIIGGTIAQNADGATPGESPSTPFGDASASMQTIAIGQANVLYLARHGPGHSIAPHDINYRANLWAFHEASVSAIVAMYAVGAIADILAVGDIVIPDQIIDYTWGRNGSFGEILGLNHFDFSEPFSPLVRHQLLLSGEKSSRTVHTTGTYGCTQGPRLETSAEIERLRKDGCDLVGMTAMPEAALARELSIPFGSICLVVNAAAGRGDGPIQKRTIQSAIAQGSPNLLDIVGRTVPGLKNSLG
ncbi:MAG: S-methyl-5'-thioinosine phosphorylase [Pseudomonadales bacterium]|nr:S-methyl-5'-thioinosine phosphorylase [Pseudomonadales bacterium]